MECFHSATGCKKYLCLGVSQSKLKHQGVEGGIHRGEICESGNGGRNRPGEIVPGQRTDERRGESFILVSTSAKKGRREEGVIQIGKI